MTTQFRFCDVLTNPQHPASTGLNSLRPL
jgi:hypothetical protein